MPRARQLSLALAAAALSCGPAPKPAAPVVDDVTLSPMSAQADETHLSKLRQLTLAGENAEAYWSWDNRQLIMQSRSGDGDCDRIYRMQIAGAPAQEGPGGREWTPPLIPVSSGKGVTTCSFFMPGNDDVIFSSTHLGGDACPPKPDMSQGYVWRLYESYDIFRARSDGENLRRLTDTPGYDAEATVCGKDGSIVFTSVRDGDLDLYRMDADGQNVKRLTDTPGYDGGAFFDRDCKRIVWRASRPKPGKELDDYKALLAKGLVRPTKLELWTANADGSDARQITYLDAASFAPYWHPSQRRVLFSSNYGDPKGREFDIWAINDDGTGLERITHAPGFDGFPMFSPDGAWLAFSSNRATAKGKHDTNVFIAKWVEGPPKVVESAADRVRADVAWLADPAREGRGIGTKGLDASGAWIEARMRSLGLAPAGDAGSHRQAFDVATSLAVSGSVSLGAKKLDASDFTALGYSPLRSKVDAPLVYARWGVVSKDDKIDDYAGVDVKGKVVVVRRFTPELPAFEKPDAQRRHGDMRHKAWLARERGAVGMIIVDAPVPAKGAPPKKDEAEAKLPELRPEGFGDAGIPILVVKRAAAADALAKATRRQPVRVQIDLELTPKSEPAFNVVGRLAASPRDGNKLPGAIVIGAHYDHLGLGGRYSLDPHSKAPHVGADDNASGVAVLLEVARALSSSPADRRRDVIFAAFSGEETGVLGSAHMVRAAGKKGPNGMPTLAGDVYAMLNMDMVGRMRDNRLMVLGTETASEWPGLVTPACDGGRVECKLGGDGYGPSDQMSFYVAGVPVLHFFTGAHSDYHKPSDDVSKINAGGAGRVAHIVASIAAELSRREGALSYTKGVDGPSSRGDMRGFNASLGTIPDYGGPGKGKKGVLLAGVRTGGGADKAGMKRGDILVRLGTHEIGSVEDLMYVLTSSKPGETVTAVVVREGKEVKLQVTFQPSHH